MIEVLATVTAAVVCLVCIALTLIGLPGTWMMALLALSTRLYAPELYSWWTIGGCLGLAVLAEISDFIAGAVGAGAEGASKRAGLAAIGGGLVGAIVGTPFLPPIGTIIGAVAGAGLSASLAEVTLRKPEELTLMATAKRAARVGRGAALGRFIAVLVKTAIAVVVGVWLVVAAAVA